MTASPLVCAAALASGLVVAPVPLLAQDDGAVGACTTAVADPAFCRTVAQGVEALVPAIVLAAAGGNPVPGSASTLGMRLTSMPRWTLGGRTTLAWGSAPDLVERGGTNTLNLLPLAFALDGSVGVLPGWNPLPTVGGMGSLDLLVGGSVIPLIASDGYSGIGGWSWAAGARVGLLRESFTLPGISVSGMYRQVHGLSLGDEELDRTDSYIDTDLGVLSARAAATKAILLLNLTGGVGYDIVYGDIEFGYASGPRLTAEDARMERVTFFGGVSYTLMVLHFVLEGGWQEAPPLIEGIVEGDDYSPDSTFYATGSLRISI